MCSDEPRSPVTGRVRAKDGTLYGATFDRGVDSKRDEAWGSLFKISGLPAVPESRFRAAAQRVRAAPATRGKDVLAAVEWQRLWPRRLDACH